MKAPKTLFFAIAFLLSSSIIAQVSISTDGSGAVESAMLEIKSSEKGFLPPRMTEAQRDAILSPATGLIIYQTDGLEGLYNYNGSNWIAINSNVNSAHYVGEHYGGGIVFYVEDDGQHGLIAALVDASTGSSWFNNLYTNTNALRWGIYAGHSNTDLIIASQGLGNYAALNCTNYSDGAIGFGDWYLPSFNELHLMYNNLHILGLGNFSNSYYWSSTENDTMSAWGISFANGTASDSDKGSSGGYVRAIRKF